MLRDAPLRGAPQHEVGVFHGSHRQVRDRPLGAALRRERRRAHRLRGGDRLGRNAGTTGAGAWSDKAAVHEAMGREALANRKFISAGEHLQRAGVYYHFGKFLFVHDVPQMKAAHMKAVECRNLALPHLNPPGERVTIPYQGKALYGILRKPNGVDEAAGADHGGRARLRQGRDRRLRAALSRSRHRDAGVRRPGQGEGEYDFAIRGDYEVAVKAVVDYVDDAERSRHRAHRPVGRQPRRLLRAARRRVREAHQGLPRARRTLRLAGGLARPRRS